MVVFFQFSILACKTGSPALVKCFLLETCSSRSTLIDVIFLKLSHIQRCRVTEVLASTVG